MALSQIRTNQNRSVAYLLVPGLVFVLSVVLIAFLGYSLLRSGQTRVYRVQMLIDLAPTRTFLAKRIAKDARRHGLEIELSSKRFGTQESLDLVDTPNPIDLALVPGGFAWRDYPNVRQVAMLSLEALHVVVRPELAEGGFANLRGRRINLGPPKTARHALARDVLAFAGLHPREDDKGNADYLVDETTAEELHQKLLKIQELSGEERDRAVRELPDATFLLETAPAITVSDFVQIANFRMTPIPFAHAYCSDRLRPSAAGAASIDRSNFSAIEIPPYTYSVDPAVPVAPYQTIGTRLLMIAYNNSDPEAVSRLVETLFDGSTASLTQPVPLRSQILHFPLHEGTERFLRRNDPIVNSETVGSLGKFAGAIGAFSSALIALYSFMHLRKLRRFDVYFQEIRQIELIARGLEIDPAAPVEPTSLLTYLDNKLHDLKIRAINEFSEGGMKGESLMMSIVSLVNDTRGSLASLGTRDRH